VEAWLHGQVPCGMPQQQLLCMPLLAADVSTQGDAL
jgi:hypothetical protein